MHRRNTVVHIDDSSDSDSDIYSDSDRESCSDSADSSPESPKIKYSGPDEYLSEMIKFFDLDSSPGVGWDDIAGLHEAKRLLKEVVVLPRLIPEYFKGIRRPWRGALLYGPPGTAKTLLAKAIATEGGTKFFHVTSASLASKWYGESGTSNNACPEIGRPGLGYCSPGSNMRGFRHRLAVLLPEKRRLNHLLSNIIQG
ncbi:hypothetical protein OROMI_004897 [Orobanche minor]